MAKADDIARAAYAVGLRGEALVMAVAIALGESGGNPRAYNPHGLDKSYGYWQINMHGSLGPARRRQFGLSSNDQLFDPMTNARAMFAISSGGRNWRPWTVYTRGIYRQHLGEARAAAGRQPMGVGAIGGGIWGGAGAGGGGGGAGGFGGGGIGGDLGFQSRGAPADVAKSMYGYLGWFVDHPEVGPIILRAAEQGWDLHRLMGALSGTRWWQTTSEASRQWDALVTMDPATAERRIDETAGSIGLQAAKFGVNISNGRLAQMAVKALRFGWNPAEIQLAISAEMRYDPRGRFQGAVGQMVNDVRKTAAGWLVGVTQRQAWEWARRMVAGGATMDGVNAAFQKLSKARFPHLATQIDQGISPGQFFTPHRQAIANLLEVPAESVNFLSKKWDPVMSFSDSSTGKRVTRAMTVTEAERFARMDPTWGKTQNAWQSLTETGDAVMQLFGARAT